MPTFENEKEESKNRGAEGVGCGEGVSRVAKLGLDDCVNLLVPVQNLQLEGRSPSWNS